MQISRLTIAALLLGSFALSSCGAWRDSRINPGNWFGRSDDVPVQTEETAAINPLIPQERERVNLFGRDKDKEEIDNSVALAQITDLSVEPSPTGAIILATGEAHRIGAYDVKLEPVPGDDPATLTYSLRATYPNRPTARGTEATRTLRAATTISTQDLRRIRTIRVVAEQNARETRR